MSGRLIGRTPSQPADDGPVGDTVNRQHRFALAGSGACWFLSKLPAKAHLAPTWFAIIVPAGGLIVVFDKDFQGLPGTQTTTQPVS